MIETMMYCSCMEHFKLTKHTVVGDTSTCRKCGSIKKDKPDSVLIEDTTPKWESGLIPIEWSETKQSTEEVNYTHVIGKTPIGNFLLTWKGWKPEYSISVDIDETPFKDTPITSHSDVDDAIEYCNKLWETKIKGLFKDIQIVETKKLFDIWQQGYSANGQSEQARQIAFKIEAETFREACIIFSKRNSDLLNKEFDEKELSIWGCKLFDNETDARKVFG